MKTVKRDVNVEYGTYEEMMARLRQKHGDVEFSHELYMVEGIFATFEITYHVGGR